MPELPEVETMRRGVLPVVGNPSAIRVNLVPRDYVVEAMSYLSGLEAAVKFQFSTVEVFPDQATARAVAAEVMTQILADHRDRDSLGEADIVAGTDVLRQPVSAAITTSGRTHAPIRW